MPLSPLLSPSRTNDSCAKIETCEDPLRQTNCAFEYGTVCPHTGSCCMQNFAECPCDNDNGYFADKWGSCVRQASSPTPGV